MPSTSRPRSPHLQIYRPQLTSVLSFTHRVTGVALSVGAVLLVVWLVAAASGAEAFTSLQGFLGSALGLVLLFVWTFALFYHLCNGIRHLFWDAVHGLELSSIYGSGWAVVAASVVLTLGAWIMGAIIAG